MQFSEPQNFTYHEYTEERNQARKPNLDLLLYTYESSLKLKSTMTSYHAKIFFFANITFIRIRILPEHIWLSLNRIKTQIYHMSRCKYRQLRVEEQKSSRRGMAPLRKKTSRITSFEYVEKHVIFGVVAPHPLFFPPRRERWCHSWCFYTAITVTQLEQCYSIKVQILRCPTMPRRTSSNRLLRYRWTCVPSLDMHLHHPRVSYPLTLCTPVLYCFQNNRCTVSSCF